MSADSSPAFVDTNVLVYCFEKSASPQKPVAQTLVEQLMDQNRLRVSTQVLQELFVTLTRRGKGCSNQEARGYLHDMAAWPVAVTEYEDIESAITLVDRAKLSFWDALIVVSASRSGSKTLYTEDLNHGQTILGVRVINPFRTQ